MSEYTLKHTQTQGTAAWLYFDFQCENISPADYPQLITILEAEGKTADAQKVREALNVNK